VRELAELVIAEHQTTSQQTTQRPGRQRDMVDDLLAAHAERPDEYTERDLRVGVVGPYVAGLDTVANTCTFALYALLREPEALRRVVAEVDAAMADGPLTAEKLKTMPALQGAVMETLRLYPVAALSQRTVTTPFTFYGYRVAAETSLLIATGMTHVLPELFLDPTRFDIDRYEAPRNEHRARGAYAPYGLGAHVCLGAGLAGIQIALNIAQLLHTTEFELPADCRPKLRQDPTLTFGAEFRLKVVGRRGS
jgi:cytochrome P450